MTECPKCKGYGIVGSAVPDILRGRGAIFSSNECDICHGSGEVDMTNEEWFASLSTKEKAKWMFRLTYKCYWCGREYADTKKYNEKECPFHKCLDDSKGFEKWLKQPHTNE